MPGKLVMDHQGAIGSTDLKKDRSQAQQAHLPHKPNFTADPASTLAGHRSGHLPAANGGHSNGISSHNPPVPTTNGQPGLPASLPSPPALDQSWRESDHNPSMGVLIDRLTQKAFEDFSEQLDKMSQPYHGQHQVDDTIAKKLALMQFFNSQRDRFVKTRVLTDWVRRYGEENAKLVDIHNWQQVQRMAQLQAIESIGHTKHDLRQVKMQEPNLDGALQLLATGKAPSTVPHLGYIPPKRFTARQLLRTLQNMNVILATRLNLHDELPPHFNDFSIANGRATFRVPGEFEVDLSVAEDEPSSPFYFIDIRFLFAPAPGILSENIRTILEARINTALAAEGLQGGYDILHSFVLTHKLTVLYDQISKIASDKWFGCIGREKQRGVKILKYWIGQKRGKSWLEFGVSTGKQHRTSRRPPTPALSMRWFRKGSLVEDEVIEIDWTRLDIEKILTQVIARHASWTLTQIKDRLQALTGMDAKLDTDLRTSSTKPEDCALKLSLPGLDAPLLVRLEPVTGRFSLSPPTPRAIYIERALNNDRNPDDKTHIHLANLLCKTVQDRVSKAAEIAGWTFPDARSIREDDSFRTIFGKDVGSWKPYSCSTGWGDRWVVMVTVCLSGEKWYVARLEAIRNQSTTPDATKVVTFAQRISTRNVAHAVSDLSRASMLRIERLAVAEVSFAVLSQQLESMRIPYRLEKHDLLTFSESKHTSSPIACSVFFRSSALPKGSLSKDFMIDSVQITHQGVLEIVEGDDGAKSKHEMRLTVETKTLHHLRAYLATKTRGADVAMNASGALSLRLRTTFGQPYLEQLLSRLRACERLDRYLEEMKRFGFGCTTVTLHKVSFTYGRSSQWTATIVFPSGDGNLPGTLKLGPAGINPHQRTRVMLERVLNHHKFGNSFWVMCRSIYYTGTVLQTLEKMELANHAKSTIYIHIRNPALFTVAYKPPAASVIFRVELCERRQNSKVVLAWKIKSDKSRQELSTSDAGKAILEFGSQKTEEWWGLGDGTFCAFSSAGAVDILDKLDTAMRKFEIPVPMNTTSGQMDAKPPPKALPQPPQQRPQQKPSKASQQKPPSQKAPQHKTNGPPTANGPRTMTVNASASGNSNGPSRNNKGKVKKEVIELD